MSENKGKALRRYLADCTIKMIGDCHTIADFHGSLSVTGFVADIDQIDLWNSPDSTLNFDKVLVLVRQSCRNAKDGDGRRKAKLPRPGGPGPESQDPPPPQAARSGGWPPGQEVAAGWGREPAPARGGRSGPRETARGKPGRTSVGSWGCWGGEQVGPGHMSKC